MSPLVAEGPFQPHAIKHAAANNLRWIVAGFLSLPFALMAMPAWSHVRWFVDPSDPSLELLEGYAFSDPAVLTWIAVGFAIIGASIFLDDKLLKVRVVDSKTRHDVMEIVRIFVGMSFLLTAYEGGLVAPHFRAFGGFGLTLLLLQAAIGIMLIANRWLQHAAVLMMLLYLGMVAKFGFFAALEYCNIVGIALFLLFNNFRTAKRLLQFKPYSVASLRIFTGVALVALAIGEKLQGAMLGQAFIAAYGWNFMQLLGFEWFDDRLLVLSAGMAEAIFGILLILGTTTRLTILALSAIMALSNVAFIMQEHRVEAMTEFIGHLPLIATALLLVFLGYGQRLKATDMVRDFVRARREAKADTAAQNALEGTKA
ncbi:MAG: hypothetical protein AAGH60_04840 [Pseudomonadota bacterium]